MKIKAKIGTGPGVIVDVDGRRYNAALKRFANTGAFSVCKFRYLGAGAKWMTGLIRGQAGDAVMIERW